MLMQTERGSLRDNHGDAKGALRRSLLSFEDTTTTGDSAKYRLHLE